MATKIDKQVLEADLSQLCNKHGLDNFTNTPDFILGAYLAECINNYAATTRSNMQWHSWPSLAEKLGQPEDIEDLHA